MNARRWGLGLSLTAALAAAALLGGARGQQVIQYGFEARDPVWVPGTSDAAYKELAHRLTDQSAHTGQKSEYLQLQVEQGSYIHYTYAVGRAPVTDELRASVWLKASVPGVQLLCRVVLPAERDPHNSDQPLTVLLKGDAYQLVGRWQQLAVRQPVKRLREQAQLLRAELKRDVITADAYVDRLVLNVYGSQRPFQRDRVLTEVWVDDLEVGPVLEARPPAPAAARDVPARTAGRRAAEVQLRGNQLLVSGQKFFPRIIRHSGPPLKTLRDAGFNTVLLDETTPASLVEDAVDLGFWIIPSVTPPPVPEGAAPDARLTSANEAFARTVGRFLDQEAVLWYDLGTNLESEKFPAVSRAAQAFRAIDPMRPVGADVWDGFARYSRGVDQLVLGVHRWPLMTTLELPAYRDWLVQRRQLAQPGTFCWTWIQTHLPDAFVTTAYDQASDPRKVAPKPGVDPEPLGPQPEQIRLLAYTAIGAGYRGLGFWSDRYLADSHNGRDRLLALALLNQELQMLEPLLLAAKEPTWIDTSQPNVKAAVLRTVEGKALLVLPVWMGPGSQFVPGQAAAAELSLVVPQVPNGAWAYEVSPGQVRSLPFDRVVGGSRITLREFSLTSAVVFTSDLGPTGLLVRLQDQQRRMARVAAQWAHDQAEEELAKVVRVNADLEQAGHRLPDGAKLLAKSREYLQSCQAHRRNGEHAEAYADAQRALRPLRILMRAQWEEAVRPLDTPAASPYAVSFFTLPRHWAFVEEITKLRPDANLLPDGDFEAPPEKRPANWLVEEVPPLDDVTGSARRVSTAPHSGRQCLMLEVQPKDKQAPPGALERTFLALHSPAVRLPPGTPVRVSAWVRVPERLQATADGALFYDSAGGESLGVRLTEQKAWKQFTLYRRVPPSGVINVTLALTGLGSAYFDDVRIEPLVAQAAPAAPTTTARSQ
jgi:hypothetical protein